METSSATRQADMRSSIIKQLHNPRERTETKREKDNKKNITEKK